MYTFSYEYNEYKYKMYIKYTFSYDFMDIKSQG